MGGREGYARLLGPVLRSKRSGGADRGEGAYQKKWRLSCSLARDGSRCFVFFYILVFQGKIFG